MLLLPLSPFLRSLYSRFTFIPAPLANSLSLSVLPHPTPIPFSTLCSLSHPRTEAAAADPVPAGGQAPGAHSLPQDGQAVGGGALGGGRGRARVRVPGRAGARGGGCGGGCGGGAADQEAAGAGGQRRYCKLGLLFGDEGCTRVKWNVYTHTACCSSRQN